MARRKASDALTQGADALREARRFLAQLQASKQVRRKLTDQERRARDRAIKRAKDAELRAQRAELRAYGLYETRGAELTRGRKQRIRRAHIALENYKRNAIYAPLPKGKAAKRQVEGIVKRHGGKVTRRGVFVEREAGEMRLPGTSTRLIRDRETGLWEIEQIRVGETQTITSHVYLDSLEALEAQEKVLKRKFDGLAKNLAKDERVRFTIGGPNGNVSRRAFSSWETFKVYVMAYRRDPRAQASFMASLVVYVAARTSPGVRDYRVPVAWADRLGRRREAAADHLYDGGLFPKNKPRRSKALRGRKPGKP